MSRQKTTFWWPASSAGASVASSILAGRCRMAHSPFSVGSSPGRTQGLGWADRCSPCDPTTGQPACAQKITIEGQK